MFKKFLLSCIFILLGVGMITTLSSCDNNVDDGSCNITDIQQGGCD